MTLNQITYDILETCSHIDREKADRVSELQVKAWIHQYRLLLIKEEISKNSIIDPKYITYKDFTFKILNIVHDDAYVWSILSEEEMPDLAPLIGRVGVTSSWVVYDGKPNERIPVTVRDISASFYGGLEELINPKRNLMLSIWEKKIKLYGFGSGMIVPYPEDIKATCGLICANAEDYFQLDDQYDINDTEYPLPDDRIPRLKSMIFSSELLWLMPARDTAAAAQMAKVEEQELNNNPTALLQQGSDLYEGLD